MSRTTVAIAIILYLVASLSFAFFERTQNPFWTFDAGTIGESVGGALAIFIGGALIPIIIWGLMRFRASRAAVPLLLWLAIGGAFAYLSHVGAAADRGMRTEKFANDGLVGKNKDDFLRSTKLGCEQQQRSNLLTPKIGITEKQIVDYCDCYAAGASEALTTDELRYIVMNGRPPASFTDKATKLGNFCGQQILGARK